MIITAEYFKNATIGKIEGHGWFPSRPLNYKYMTFRDKITFTPPDFSENLNFEIPVPTKEQLLDILSRKPKKSIINRRIQIYH
jgi:hypothetical protein